MFSDSDSSGLKSCRRPGSLCFWYLMRDSGMYTPFFLFQYQQSGLDTWSSLKPSTLYSFPRLHLRSAYDTMDTGLYFFSKYARSFPAAPTTRTFSRLQNLVSSHSCFLSNLHLPNVISDVSSPSLKRPMLTFACAYPCMWFLI